MGDMKPQDALAGKYRLVRPLGKGGMGEVWLADHLTLRCPVAVKILNPKVENDDDFRARFFREARASAALRSPHVVQILDYGVDGNRPFIVMELLEGESLAQRLWREGQLTPAQTARILTQVGRAMTRAHEAGVVHRDLKPDNVFLVKNDEEEVAKVVDFGIAKATMAELEGPASVSTDTGRVLGTCHYMSPEQAAGSKTVDHRTDIWSLGVMAYECLVGRRPFQADTLGGFFQAIYGKPLPVPSHSAVVPAGFDEWFARACAHEADARFALARDACADLRRVCDQQAARAPLPGVDNPTLSSASTRAVADTLVAPSTSDAMIASELASRSPRRSRRTPLALAGLGVSALAIGALLWAHQRAPVSDGAGPPGAATAGALAAHAQVPTAPTEPPARPAAVVTSPATAASAANDSPGARSPSAAGAPSARPTSHEPGGQARPLAADRRHRTRRATELSARPEPPRAAAPAFDAAPSAPRVDLGL